MLPPRPVEPVPGSTRSAARRWAAVLAGVLGANSTPHLVTAARRGRRLTPFGGQDSGPAANLAWGTVNASVATALLAYAGKHHGVRRLLPPFLLGCAAFGAWAFVYETVLAPRESAGTADDPDSGRP